MLYSTVFRTIAEPGGHRTRFTNSLDVATPLTAYRHGPVAEFRRVASADDTYTGDTLELASKIIEVTKVSEPPLRLVIGEDAYTVIDTALRGRLHALQEGRDASGPTPLEG